MDGFSDRGSIPLASTNDTTSINRLIMRFVGVLFLGDFKIESGLMVVFGIAQQVCKSILNQLSCQLCISLYFMTVYSECIHIFRVSAH